MHKIIIVFTTKFTIMQLCSAREMKQNCCRTKMWRKNFENLLRKFLHLLFDENWKFCMKSKCGMWCVSFFWNWLPLWKGLLFLIWIFLICSFALRCQFFCVKWYFKCILQPCVKSNSHININMDFRSNNYQWTMVTYSRPLPMHVSIFLLFPNEITVNTTIFSFVLKFCRGFDEFIVPHRIRAVLGLYSISDFKHNENDGYEINFRNFIIHPKYTCKRPENDIGSGIFDSQTFFLCVYRKITVGCWILCDFFFRCLF